ncbi:unnamed protein product [Calypogeia fissa]
MDKVRVTDFQGALACWDVNDANACESELRLFFLQRGILKQMGGDLRGALEDLTAALKIYGTVDDPTFLPRRDMNNYAYNYVRHRGSVKFLLGDMDGAQKDGAMALLPK